MTIQYHSFSLLEPLIVFTKVIIIRAILIMPVIYIGYLRKI